MKNIILKKNKVRISSNSIIQQINKLMREPVYLTIKSLYPKFFRIDDIQEDQSNKFKESDFEFILKDIGKINRNFNTIIKPILIPLSLDHIDFNCSYVSDDGEFINLYIFNFIKQEFYQDLFGVSTFENALKLASDSIEEDTSNDLNSRIVNIINQLRKDNKGPIQPIKIIFLE